MPAYLIAYIEVTDSEAYAAYQKEALPTLASYGGKVVVGGIQHEVLEGMIQPKSVVVVEFESLAQARNWYASPEFARTIPMRQRAASSSLILVEGR